MLVKELSRIKIHPAYRFFNARECFVQKNMEVGGRALVEMLDNSISKKCSIVPIPIKIFSLLETKNDRDISKELPKRHFWGRKDLWVIPQLIAEQPRGGKGTLVSKTGCTNLFYFRDGNKKITVSVYWTYGYTKWSVYGWEYEFMESWKAGAKIFCPDFSG